MNEDQHPQYSENTLAWLNQADINWRKTHGQFMTPKFLREQLLDSLNLKSGLKVLDPAVGTGELLLEAASRQKGLKLEGWDIDNDILKVAEKNITQAKLVNKSALEVACKPEYDLIIANPPYFQFKADKQIKDKFSQVISGRTNIFACFFQLSLQLLKPGGQLGFIVPPSMNNGAYFQALREYITKYSSIKQLTIYSDQHFSDAQTAVQIIVLEKKQDSELADKSKQQYVFKYHQDNFSRIIFTKNKSILEKVFKQGKTVHQLGFKVQTGSIVWNQHKQDLREQPDAKTSLLLWSHNIEDQTIKLKQHKPQYIEVNEKQIMTGPAIICNRVIGGVNQGQLKCALISSGTKFVAENHINLITADNPLISFEDLYQLLIQPSTTQLARMITGNTQLSGNELLHLIPLSIEGNDS
jgi:adenine-specific DNA-methyltransferase